MTIFLAAAALAFSQAPQAAGDASCLLSALQPAERAAIARASYEGGGPSPSDAPLDAAVRNCTQRLRWDEPRARVAIPLALGTILRDDARTVLASRGISADVIDRWFAAQTVAVRTTTELSDGDLERMLGALSQAGVPTPVLEANGVIVGTYLGARIMIERVERGLPFD